MNQNSDPHYVPPDDAHQTVEPTRPFDEQSSEADSPKPRQLRRSRQDRVIAGVCGGLGRHLDIAPVLFRIAFLVSFFAGGVGLIAYIIFWVAVPEFKSQDEEERDLPVSSVSRTRTGLIAGGALILLGVLILLREFIPWFDARVIGALVLIGIGAVVLIRGMQRE